MFRAAQRASARPPFMAWLLARFQAQHGCSGPQLAAYLGLPPRLPLCFKAPDRTASPKTSPPLQPGSAAARRPGRPRAAGHRRRAFQRLTPPGVATTRHDAATAAFRIYGLPYLRFLYAPVYQSGCLWRRAYSSLGQAYRLGSGLIDQSQPHALSVARGAATNGGRELSRFLRYHVWVQNFTSC